MAELTAIPPKPRAGDTWTWRRTYTDYPASDWTATIYLQGPNGTSVEATADGDDHIYSIPAATTALFPAGELAWFERVDDGTDAYTVAMGTIDVQPDYKAGMPFDSRTSAKKMLEAVEATILKLLSRTTQSASFGDQTFTVHDLDKLRQIRADLRAEVASERGTNRGQTIRIKFPTV